MEDLITTTLESGGLGAVSLVALVFMFFLFQKNSKIERESWKKTSEKQFKDIVRISTESTTTIAENTNMISSLKDAILLQRKTCSIRKEMMSSDPEE